MGKTSIYVGESAICAYDRGREHLAAIARDDPESPLVEHRDLEHPGQQVAFEMRISCFPRSTLYRQATEAFQIEQNKANNVLNRRGEWGQNIPPKLVVEGEEENAPKEKKRAKMASSFGEQRSSKRQRTKEPPEEKEDEGTVAKENHVESNPPETRPKPRGKNNCVSYEERIVIEPKKTVQSKKQSKKKEVMKGKEMLEYMARMRESGRTSILEQQQDPPHGEEQGDAPFIAARCPEDPQQTSARPVTPDEALTTAKQRKFGAGTGKKSVHLGVKGGQPRARPKGDGQPRKSGQGKGLKISNQGSIEGYLPGQPSLYKPDEPPDPHSKIYSHDNVEVRLPDEELEPGPSGTPFSI